MYQQIGKLNTNLVGNVIPLQQKGKGTMKKTAKPKARMYKIGDWYTSNKAGVVGQIEKITPLRPDLTRVAIRTPFNEYRLLTVKVTA